MCPKFERYKRERSRTPGNDVGKGGVPSFRPLGLFPYTNARMVLTVHHLQRSQSERTVWLCEELGIPYELKVYARNKQDLLAPKEYKQL